MPRFSKEDQEMVNTLPQDFLARLRSTIPTDSDLISAREQYGELPDDVIEEVARQQAAARPILEQYHLIAESAPTLAIARASMMRDIDNIMDMVVAIDPDDLGDVGDWADEYTCPKCAHAWSGAPNYRTGYAGKVYVPKGTLSVRTGKMQYEAYGKGPTKTVRNFKYGRNWRGAGSAALPRGYGNKPIGEPIVGETWRRKKKKNVYNAT